MPASSAMRASLRLSGQLPDQRSGTSVTARPDEQFDPNRPILSRLALCIDRRSRADETGACTCPSRSVEALALSLAQPRRRLNGMSAARN